MNVRLFPLLVAAPALAWAGACDGDDDAAQPPSEPDEEAYAEEPEPGEREDAPGPPGLDPDDPGPVEAQLEMEADGQRPEAWVGAWQLGHPEVAAGLASTFHFFEDGLFVYNRGVSDACEEGTIYRVGTWSGDDAELVLREERRLEERGGEPEDGPHGCERVGAERVVVIGESPELERIAVSECSDDEKQEYQTYYEELGADCRRFDGDARWTAAAGTESWRAEWMEWFADRRVASD